MQDPAARDRLLAVAREWQAHDPDPITRAELAAVIAAVDAGERGALTDLGARFSGPLTFGTAGLRGEVGAGQSRMNVAVVIRATAGLAQYLLDTVGPGARVVVGCDARHRSSDFMAAALQVLSAAGLTAIALPQRQPTPLTAFAVRALDADAGVMVTASHNPPADNGYKVYLGGRAADDAGRGAQLVAPADAAIAERIAAAPAADAVPRSGDRIEAARESLIDEYVARAARGRSGEAPSRVRVVLTPMHGVGGDLCAAVFARAGIVDVHRVAEQWEPDADFSTVAFPNPEEPGALDRALEVAREVDADVVIALDPDADRCAVAVPAAEGWRALTGDELGALLGDQAAGDAARPGGTLACSIVSSRLLGAIAAAHGLRFAQTLTGFKWIARTPDLRFGYEEAIGYCTDPDAVRDKDGIGAAVRVVALMDQLAERGATLTDRLDELAREHGLYATAQRSFRVDNLALIAEAMARLRAAPPTMLAGSRVVDVVDLAAGSADLPPTDGVVLRTVDDGRVIVRPSGTEPKLKCYLETVMPVGDGEPIPRAEAARRLDAVGIEVAAILGLGPA